jgi:hypothetical protein
MAWAEDPACCSFPLLLDIKEMKHRPAKSTVAPSGVQNGRRAAGWYRGFEFHAEMSEM